MSYHNLSTSPVSQHLPQLLHCIPLNSLPHPSLYLTQAMHPRSSHPFSLPIPRLRSASYLYPHNLTLSLQTLGTPSLDPHNRTRLRSHLHTPSLITRSPPARRSPLPSQMRTVQVAMITGLWKWSRTTDLQTSGSRRNGKQSRNGDLGSARSGCLRNLHFQIVRR